MTAPDHEQAERIINALVPHKGHAGIPGAPEGVFCLRCNAERALSNLAAQLAEREREKAGLRDLLRECHGWMNGVDPKPAQPFLDAVLAATHSDGEASDD